MSDSRQDILMKDDYRYKTRFVAYLVEIDACGPEPSKNSLELYRRAAESVLEHVWQEFRPTLGLASTRKHLMYDADFTDSLIRKYMIEVDMDVACLSKPVNSIAEWLSISRKSAGEIDLTLDTKWVPVAGNIADFLFDFHKKDAKKWKLKRYITLKALKRSNWTIIQSVLCSYKELLGEELPSAKKLFYRYRHEIHGRVVEKLKLQRFSGNDMACFIFGLVCERKKDASMRDGVEEVWPISERAFNTDREDQKIKLHNADLVAVGAEMNKQRELFRKGSADYQSITSTIREILIEKKMMSSLILPFVVRYFYCICNDIFPSLEILLSLPRHSWSVQSGINKLFPFSDGVAASDLERRFKRLNMPQSSQK